MGKYTKQTAGVVINFSTSLAFLGMAITLGKIFFTSVEKITKFEYTLEDHEKRITELEK